MMNLSIYHYIAMELVCLGIHTIQIFGQNMVNFMRLELFIDINLIKLFSCLQHLVQEARSYRQTPLFKIWYYLKN